MSKPFDCPKCEHYSEHKTALRGAVAVFWHFFVRHGWYSFKIGLPFSGEEPPQFDETVEQEYIGTLVYELTCPNCGEEVEIGCEAGDAPSGPISCPACGAEEVSGL